MYYDFYSEDPDYFGQQDVQPRNTSSYYYDGRGNLYQGGYGKIVSGQDPCYYANMRNQQRAQNPFMNPESRRYMNGPQAYQAPIPGTYGDPNYFNQEPVYYGYGSRDPQYFGYSYQDPNTRRYGNTPYTPQAYQAYQPKPAPVVPPQPQGGLNTDLFAQQRGYSNPINQSMPQQVPQRQLLRVSCPQQTNGFGPNKWNTPKLPSNPNIDWSALSGINAVDNPAYPASGYAYGQGRTIPLPPQNEQSWYEIARQNFGR